MAQLNELLTLLRQQPECAKLLVQMVAAEEAEIEAYRGKQLQEWERLRSDGLPEGWGLERMELGARQRWLDDLVYHGALEVVSISRGHRPYRVKDRETVKRALAAFTGPAPVEEAAEEIPHDLFSIIVGHEDVKRVLALSIAAPRPVHALLVGEEPATAKTLFLEELGRLPGALYADGGLATKAGIVEALLAEQPRYLLIDQVDHLPADDQQALLGVMASGRVARLRYRQHEDEQRLVWVFASANMTRRLSLPLLDRFHVIPFHRYTMEQFVEVCRQFLVQREGLDAGLASYVAAQVAPRTGSIRAVQRVARLAQGVGDVDDLVQLLFPEESTTWSRELRSARRR